MKTHNDPILSVARARTDLFLSKFGRLPRHHVRLVKSHCTLWFNRLAPFPIPPAKKQSPSQFPQNYNYAAAWSRLAVQGTSVTIERFERAPWVNERRCSMMIILATLNGQMEWMGVGRWWPGHEMKNNRMHLMSDCLLCSYYGHLSYR